jgi:CelD/BcsL family acetyltransferase involved in cellulose biosynthesis
VGVVIEDVEAGAQSIAAARIERIGSLDAERDEWESLAAATRNVFATWEWASLSWERHRRSATLLAHSCRDGDGRLVAILPLYLSRRGPFRVARFIGHDTADQLGPICAPEHRVEVADALRGVLAESQADVFLAERVPREEGWDALLGATELTSEPSPVVRFDSSNWDEHLRTRSRNFRDQARRRERRLTERYDVSFRLVTDPESLDRDLGTLFSLHAARWSGTRTNFSEAEAFHREFAAIALARGWLRVWLLELDGHPRAVIHGFRFGDVESFYQSGRDPSFDADSVGFVLLLHAIREALGDGMTEYRLLRGGEAYKSRFANEDGEVTTLATTRTRVSRAALATAVAARRSRAYRKLDGWRRATRKGD